MYGIVDLIEGQLEEKFRLDFSSEKYLELNEDVAEFDGDPFDHFLNFGWKENRSFPLKQINESKETVQLVGFPKLFEIYEGYIYQFFSGLLDISKEEYVFKRTLIEKIFDVDFYLEQCNYNIPSSFALDHYMVVGTKNNLLPNGYFVPEEYSKIYSDIANSDVDELYHYAAEGYREGRYPRVLNSFDKFKCIPFELIKMWTEAILDAEYYLEKNSDVAGAKVDAIEHYLRDGWKEKRSPSVKYESILASLNIDIFKDINVNPILILDVLEKTGFTLLDDTEATQLAGKPTDLVDDNLSFEIETVSNYVDRDFYYKLYPDVQLNGLSAEEHYCRFGWKEQRDPSPEFSTSFYMMDNPDVVDAGVNPLFHYVVAGRFERRYPRRPGGDRADTIYSLIPLSETKKDWKVHLEPDLLNDEVIIELCENLSNNFVMSFSHDVYIKHTGGVQVCLTKEQLAFNKSDVDYLHFAPFQPLPTLGNLQDLEDKKHFLQLTLNGLFIGVVEAQNLMLILSKFKSEKSAIIYYHALHGHSPEFISQLIDELQIDGVYLWLHDYFTICEGYNLLRNNVTKCGSPSPDSKACNICVYGQERKLHVSRINSLLNKKEYTVIAPSEAAKTVWLSDEFAVDKTKVKKVLVKNHITLVKESTQKVFDSDTPIKVAFVGYPHIHKGWSEFTELVRNLIGTGKYEFFHFGAEQNKLEGVTFIQSEVKASNPTLMSDTLKNHNIDYVYIAAPWSETFNIVCYEAISAGALVITSPESGNVADFIGKSGHGSVVENVNVLINEHLQYLNKPLEKSYYSLKYSSMGYGV